MVSTKVGPVSHCPHAVGDLSTVPPTSRFHLESEKARDTKSVQASLACLMQVVYVMSHSEFARAVPSRAMLSLLLARGRDDALQSWMPSFRLLSFSRFFVFLCKATSRGYAVQEIQLLTCILDDSGLCHSCFSLWLLFWRPFVCAEVLSPLSSFLEPITISEPPSRKTFWNAGFGVGEANAANARFFSRRHT